MRLVRAHYMFVALLLPSLMACSAKLKSLDLISEPTEKVVKAPTATPSPTPSPAPTATATPSPTASSTPTVSPTATATPSPTSTPGASTAPACFPSAAPPAGTQVLACAVQSGGCDEILNDDTSVYNSAGKYFYYPTNPPTNKAGKKICIRAGTYVGLDVRSLKGASGQPVTFINCGGKVIFDAKYNGQNWQKVVSGTEAQYIRISGTGGTGDAGDPYGFEIKNASTHGIEFEQGPRDIEIDHIHIHHVSSVGIAIKSYPQCNFKYHRGNFTQWNTFVHHNWIHDTGNEGIYLGTSHFEKTWSPTASACSSPTPSPSVLDPELRNVKVCNNLVEDTGNDGIQVGAAVEGMEIYNNIISRYALAQNSGHIGGLQINPGSVGKVYNNKIEADPSIPLWGASLSAGENAIQYAGGNNGSLEVYDNLILQSKVPFMNLGMMIKPTDATTPYQTIIRNNTVVNSGGLTMYWYCYSKLATPTPAPPKPLHFLSPTEQHQFSVVDNIFVGYSNIGVAVGGGYEKIFDQGSSLCPINGSVYANNLQNNLKIPGNYYSTHITDAKFVDSTNGNYSLQGTSPALGKGAVYISP